MVLEQVRQSLQYRLNDLRSIQRVLQSKEFEDLYLEATLEERTVVNGLIREERRGEIIRWMAVIERRKLKLEDMTIRQLRSVASSLGIPGYHLLSKSQLVEAIKKD